MCASQGPPACHPTEQLLQGTSEVADPGWLFCRSLKASPTPLGKRNLKEFRVGRAQAEPSGLKWASWAEDLLYLHGLSEQLLRAGCSTTFHSWKVLRGRQSYLCSPDKETEAQRQSWCSRPQSQWMAERGLKPRNVVPKPVLFLPCDLASLDGDLTLLIPLPRESRRARPIDSALLERKWF